MCDGVVGKRHIQLDPGRGTSVGRARLRLARTSLLTYPPSASGSPAARPPLTYLPPSASGGLAAARLLTYPLPLAPTCHTYKVEIEPNADARAAAGRRAQRYSFFHGGG
jgi:hypothetical protein